ncbi:MAG TPA: OadG family protein [Halanaerobiales bacterium]|nr:OadG family protein [Halanaerobiales bacterium]
MLLDVLFISLTGILVVFGFLILLFFVLSSFKYLNKPQKEVVETAGSKENVDISKSQDKNIKIEGDVPGEVIAVIMSTLNHHDKNINEKEISIKKRR